MQKKLRKIVFFWDNCFWIGYVKMSLLRREYFSSAVNVLTNSYKVLHISKRNFSKIQKNIFVSEIIASELVTLNCLY